MASVTSLFVPKRPHNHQLILHHNKFRFTENVVTVQQTYVYDVVKKKTISQAEQPQTPKTKQMPSVTVQFPKIHKSNSTSSTPQI